MIKVSNVDIVIEKIYYKKQLLINDLRKHTITARTYILLIDKLNHRQGIREKYVENYILED
jgi:hypothetical protein